jgi:hypothetical protein
VADCHQVVGTFPNKRFALDNDIIVEAFDKYYKYTVRTNNSGDYLIMGVPVGTHTLHMDLDLSDCGVLSQRPRDFVYKGYTIDQFENPNQFKTSKNYNQLSQIFTQDQVINVHPFWGNSNVGDKIGITRADISVSYTFEPTCVFLGSVISDNSSQGISKKCIPTEHMGFMEEMVTGEGTIEMIRKTPSGAIEEFQVKGTQVINGNGIWCYQIPMNLDYMMTDEYGNMVPTDDPAKGIATRTQVRFRISMQDNEENVDNYFRAKVLVPHNPQYTEDGKVEKYDYEFGSATRDESFRDLFWNNVYSVKSYIPRFQKRKSGGWKEKKFTGLKSCNFHGSNNPMPYNNMRIDLPFAFTLMCILIKAFITVVRMLNYVINIIGKVLCFISDLGIMGGKDRREGIHELARKLTLVTISDGLCPDLENWYFAPMRGAGTKDIFVPSKGAESPKNKDVKYDLLQQTLNSVIEEGEEDIDPTSISDNNNDEENESTCLTVYTDYLISCIEMNLAMEYKVINFDFYNDWINGTVYFPRFMRYVRPKKTFLGITFARAKVKGCMDDTHIFKNTRWYTQQCAIGYKQEQNDAGEFAFTNVENPVKKSSEVRKANKMHKSRGLSRQRIFGSNGGVCHEHTTFKGQFVYYMKPCERIVVEHRKIDDAAKFERKVNLFATDIILLGSLNECDLNGVPQAFKYLTGSSYIMPTNLALTNMETNGPLYTTSAGIICSNGQSASIDNDNIGSSRVVMTSGSLSDELKALSGSGNSDYYDAYDNDLSDNVAVTEAAGISWNYTGPGQGEINENNMYYPGGHFLGIGCSNVQSNLKSCINLSRICELGVNMSQRKEDITTVSEAGEVSYTYTVPSGFIAANDISSHNFRTMFATMNNKTLRATKTNPLTGYKTYDFNFLIPYGFEGAFEKVVGYGASYNKKIELPKEDLGKYGIVDDGSYEAECANTQTRTVEKTYFDYYLYRLGLTYDDCDSNKKVAQRRKYIQEELSGSTNVYYLPQYENSYYFYFGLKNGATAIDEFNKQFFSVCENMLLIGGEPSITIALTDDLNVCDRTADISVSTSNMVTPYKKFTYENQDTGEIFNITDTALLNSYYLDLTVKFGNYLFTVIDNNDVEVNKTINIGEDVYTIDYNVRHFNTPDNTMVSGSSIIERGGYVEINQADVNGIPSSTSIFIHIINENGETLPLHLSFQKGGTLQLNRLMVPKPGHYKIQLSYNCGDGHETQYVIVSEFDVKNNSDLTLRIGKTNLELNNLDHAPSTQWWKTISGSTNTDYIYRHSLFNQIKETDRGYETFSTNIVAVGGEKVLWGLGQNPNGVSPTIMSSKDAVTELTAGYVIDDAYIYWPTYMSASGDTELMYYTATVVDETENLVMGKYNAWLVDGKVQLAEGANVLPTNCGYVFKPLPEGDLQYHKSNGSGYTYDGDYQNGIFYPTVAFPIFNRPFYAQSCLFVWTNPYISGTTDDGGVNVALVAEQEYAGKVEMSVYNGVTYKNKFHRDSSVENFNIQFKVDEDSDLMGIDTTTSRESYFSGYCGGSIDSKVFTDVSSFNYKIIGGCSGWTDSAEELARTISASTDFNFADYIKYKENIVQSGEQTTYTLTASFYDSEEIPDSGIVYYLCAQTSDSVGGQLLKVSDNKYIYDNNGGLGILVACKYKEDIANYNSEYALLSIINITSLNDRPEGDINISGGVGNGVIIGDFQRNPTTILLGYDTIVSSVTPGPIISGGTSGSTSGGNDSNREEIRINFSYNYRTSLGTVVTESGSTTYEGDKNNISEMIDMALSKCNHIEGVIAYDVSDGKIKTDFGAVSTQFLSWRKIIKRDKMNYINKTYDASNDKLYVVGVKSDAVIKTQDGEYTHAEFEAENTIFKIYPNIQKTPNKVVFGKPGTTNKLFTKI